MIKSYMNENNVLFTKGFEYPKIMKYVSRYGHTGHFYVLFHAKRSGTVIHMTHEHTYAHEVGDYSDKWSEDLFVAADTGTEFTLIV